MLLEASAVGIVPQVLMNSKHAGRHVKSEHANQPGPASRGLALRRRSNRMLLSASIGLAGEDRLKCQFDMPAKATNLNKHGAVVQLARDLIVGAVIVIKNNRGTQISARIVSQLTASKGLSTYGIEFVEHDDKANNFWGLSFPQNA